MRTIRTTSGTQLSVDAEEPMMLDLLEAIREDLKTRRPDYGTEDAVEEIRSMVEQMTLPELQAFLREFVHFAWLRYDEEISEVERRVKKARTVDGRTAEPN